MFDAELPMFAGFSPFQFFQHLPELPPFFCGW
jgi:hypothetical protein